MATDAVLTCCRDEEDIIATFVLFYLDLGFDAVYVIDNGSVDRTGEIVKMLIDAGFPVSLRRDDRLGYERHLTEWFCIAGQQLDARWLFFLDCDEFILLPQPAHDWLDALPANINLLTFRQREMYPVPRASHFLLSGRCESHFNDTTKDVARYHENARVYGGKHRIDVPAAQALCPTDAFIRHYKYRSMAQARLKEQNRLAAKQVYSDADLAWISVNGVGPAREWIEYCRRAADEERWRDSFDPIEFIEDHGMADWAESFLQRMDEKMFSRKEAKKIL